MHINTRTIQLATFLFPCTIGVLVLLSVATIQSAFEAFSHKLIKFDCFMQK